MTKAPDWKGYNAAGADKPARPRLVNTLDSHFVGRAGLALDLGCGSGRDAKELLQRGWRVDAVDSDESTIKSLASLQRDYPEKFRVIHSRFEELPHFETRYDLVNASYSLPFCPEEFFKDFWRNVIGSLKPQGIISCELFGDRDEWNDGVRKLTFFNKMQVENQFAGLDIVGLEEKEWSGPTFSSATKHWHLFECIARRL